MSVDVARNPEASRFFRTAPGTFFLKEMIADPSVPDAYKQFYYAPPRRKELKRDYILTLDRAGALPMDRHGFVPLSRLRTEFAKGHYTHRPYRDLLQTATAAAVHSFVLVFYEEQVLSYRCGKFAPSTDPLYGLRSIGLGGAVYASDNDLLFDSMFGVIASGINELGYGIGLPRRLAERARYGAEVKPYACTFLEASEGRSAVLHVVLAFACPTDFLPSKAALSVNDLRWLDVSNPANRLDDFDETSRRLFESGRVAKILATVRADGRR